MPPAADFRTRESLHDETIHAQGSGGAQLNRPCIRHMRDNCGVLHGALPYDEKSPRDMHRTTLVGDELIG